MGSTASSYYAQRRPDDDDDTVFYDCVDSVDVDLGDEDDGTPRHEGNRVAVRGHKSAAPMTRTRNPSAKRQRVTIVESVLFNPDVVFLLAALLDARDLCRVSLTCKTLAGKKAVHDGLSSVEEAARRMLARASGWERSYLPRYDDEGWIELYHHLLMLRSELTFDQIVRRRSRAQYGADRSIVHNLDESSVTFSALCSNHVMRAGRHFAVFTTLANEAYVEGSTIGVIRPANQRL